MARSAESFDEAVLLERDASQFEVAVHDASRLAWHVVVPLPPSGRAAYSFELELEVPADVVGPLEPWSALQSYARLDGAADEAPAREHSVETFRRAVVLVSSRLARARDGFVRHCTLIRSSSTAAESHWRPLLLWVEAATTELARARSGLLRAGESERAPADEFLSGQLWTVLTDCGRALFDTRRALEERDLSDMSPIDSVEAALAEALRSEIAYRHESRFELAEPLSTAQLERLLARMRTLKKHFEQVLFLDAESYQVVSRLSGWFSAFTAMLAYLWFGVVQFALERHPTTLGSGVIAIAIATAIAYASRERLKEVARNWLSGRIQRMYAQRVARYRLPSKERPRSASLVVSARESFSQSSTHASPSVRSESGGVRDATLLRFVHRGVVTRPGALPALGTQQVRFIYRLDLSPLFARLHDAVRGFASLDPRGRITIVDVPRNYELPVAATVRWPGGSQRVQHSLILNKNGLVRVEDAINAGAA
ncbi:hypothetical protein AKJ09_11077 [Labilithrix luteola]|uniref:Uncharacterized protein n=2 Tax=Labilithrix luteola TaxID=1391654 RepID=A0A0K1QF76_9BACT|nr:hypothetical protein AKJ09_11077 [Labilithrix luteola]